MKIAHIVSTYPPYKGGMGNVANEMVVNLRKIGHEVVVITPDYGQGKLDDVIYIKPMLKAGNAAFIPQLFKYLKRVDVIHLHYPFYGGAEAVWLFKILNPNKPLVVFYHMDNAQSGYRRVVFSIYRKIFFPLMIKSADLVIASSMDYAEHSFLRPYLSGINLKVLPFGVDYDFTHKKKKSNKEFTVLFVGGLDKAHYFKGLEHLLTSLATMRQNQIKLNVVGSGDMMRYYQKKAVSLGLGEQCVNFCGSLGNDKLISLYQNADVLVLPSINKAEAFGLVLIESMACGTPVIASDLPGVRSVVQNGETGLLVPVQDADALKKAINYLINNPQKASEMSRKAIDHVEKNYRWPRIIQKLEGFYQELL